MINSKKILKVTNNKDEILGMKFVIFLYSSVFPLPFLKLVDYLITLYRADVTHIDEPV
jgi:hypothetical protein